MNFLAHLFLSEGNERIQLGNFMADGIRGKDYLNFPDEIRYGILLHREIDSFTDTHPLFRQSTKRLHQNYHHYAGVIVDIYYDHFLAKNWSVYAATHLPDFIADFYASLAQNFQWLTPRAKAIYPHMVAQNWLMSYQTIEGLSRIFSQMDQRTGNQSNMQHAVTDLLNNYMAYEAEFTAFFAELQKHAQHELKKLRKELPLSGKL